MAGRRPRYDGDDLWEHIVPGIIAAFILAALGIVITAITYANMVSNTNHEANVRSTYMSEFQSLSPGERQTFANQLLDLQRHGINPNTYVGDGSIADGLRQVAKTGAPLLLDTHHQSWHTFNHVVLPIYFLSLIALVSIAIAISYAVNSYGECEFLIDLPRRRWWKYCFVAGTPVLWPAYVVSAFRLRRYRAHLQARDQESAADGTPAPPRDTDDAPPREEPPPAASTPVFEDQPELAFERYVELRLDGWRNYLKDRKRTVQERLSYLRGRANNLAQQVQEAQAEHGSLRAEQRRLDEIDIESVTPVTSPNEEFDRLRALPGVCGVRPLDNGICLFVKARLTYKGERYDLGDWLLSCYIDGRIATTELRRGARPGYRGDPVYRIDTGFCFGDARQSTITAHLLKGQLLEAFDLAIECMHSVNEYDEEQIPAAFRRAED